MSTATVTGESVPHSRDAAPCANHGQSLMECRNVLLAGTTMAAGQAKALVFATGAHTAFAEIARLTRTTGETLSPLQREIARLSRLVAGLAVGLGLLFFLLGRAAGLPPWANFLFAIGIIVANVPEGLLPTVTIALAMGSQRMAKRNALIRHLPAVETLGSTTVICTDKTGTLTMNQMAVRSIHAAGQRLNANEGGELAELARRHRMFFEIAAHCHDLTLSQEAGKPIWLGDPMERALVEFAELAGVESNGAVRLTEIPFDSDRKRLTTLHRLADGAEVLLCKGAPEVVLGLCREAVDEDSRVRSMEEADRDGMAREAAAMAEAGLRVLALAYSPRSSPRTLAEDEKALIFAGLVGLEDPPRPEVPEAIQRCREAGIKVIMVTGDHPRTAEAIGRRIGLIQSDRPVFLTGQQLGRMSDTQLQLALDAAEIHFARLAADQKMRIVQALQRKREVVAVTGDGVNDAPALKAADIGIAMGISGTDVAREAADMVLLDDHFGAIVAAVEEGRGVFANLRKFLTYILSSNVPEIVPYLAYVLWHMPLALTVIQILAVDLGTDMLPALALGAEPPRESAMKRPPRPRSERLLHWPLLARAYLWLGLMEAIAGMSAFWLVAHAGGWNFGEALSPSDPLYRQGTTACLASIVVMQMVNVFLCRGEAESAFRRGVPTNRLLLCGVALEALLIFAIAYTPWGNAFLGAAPIPGWAWLFMLPCAAGMLALEELRKWRVRRTVDRQGPRATSRD